MCLRLRLPAMACAARQRAGSAYSAAGSAGAACGTQADRHGHAALAACQVLHGTLAEAHAAFGRMQSLLDDFRTAMAAALIDGGVKAVEWNKPQSVVGILLARHTPQWFSQCLTLILGHSPTPTNLNGRIACL